MQKGKIIAYSRSASAGVIEGEDTTYYFNISHWLSPEIEPTHNLKVVFESGEGSARNVKVADGSK